VREAGRVGLRRRLFEPLDGTRQAAGFIRGLGEWNVLRVIAGGDGFNRAFEVLDFEVLRFA